MIVSMYVCMYVCMYVTGYFNKCNPTSKHCNIHTATSGSALSVLATATRVKIAKYGTPMCDYFTAELFTH